MTSGRLGIPIEEFVNVHEPEDQHHIVESAFRRLSNCMHPRMDVNQQKIACGIIFGVSVFSATVGFLCMFAIGHSNLSLMTRLNSDSVVDESFITDEIFERISVRRLRQFLNYTSLIPHPSGKTRDGKIEEWIKRTFNEMGVDHVDEPEYEVLLSFPTGENKV